MNYLKSYKFFESMNSFKENNEKYLELIEILQSKLFDDYDIISKTNEDFYDDDDYPEYKFWCYLYNGKLGTTPNDFKIERLFIYNITNEEVDDFISSLNGIKGLVDEVLNKELVFTVDQETLDKEDVDGSTGIFDFQIYLLDYSQ